MVQINMHVSKKTLLVNVSIPPYLITKNYQYIVAQVSNLISICHVSLYIWVIERFDGKIYVDAKNENNPQKAPR